MGPEARSEWHGGVEALAHAAHADAMQWELLREQWEVAQQLAQAHAGEATVAADFSQLGFLGAHYGGEGLSSWDLQSEFDQQMQGFDQWSAGPAPKGTTIP